MIQHPFDAIKIQPPPPKTPEPLPAVWQLEMPYQLVMIACLLELLLVAVLVPRGDSASVVVYQSVAALRALALLGLVLLITTYKTREILTAMLVWAAMLAAPELWAFALEARAGVPLSLFGSVLLAFGIHAAFRLWRFFGLIWLTIVLGSLFLMSWRSLEFSSPGALGLLALSSLMFGLAYWKNK